jgi:hypothetical protein
MNAAQRTAVERAQTRLLELRRKHSRPAPAQAGPAFPGGCLAGTRIPKFNRKNTEYVERTQHQGTTITDLTALVDDKLKGVQLPLLRPETRAYRVLSDNGSLVLCDRHLDLRRAAGEAWRLTGEAFAAELCDDCEDSNV